MRDTRSTRSGRSMRREPAAVARGQWSPQPMPEPEMRTMAPKTRCAHATPSVDVRAATQRLQWQLLTVRSRTPLRGMQRAPRAARDQRQHDAGSDRPRDFDRARWRRAAIRPLRARAKRATGRWRPARTRSTPRRARNPVGEECRNNAAKCVGGSRRAARRSGKTSARRVPHSRRRLYYGQWKRMHHPDSPPPQPPTFAAPAPARPLERRRGAHRLDDRLRNLPLAGRHRRQASGPAAALVGVGRRRHLRALRRAHARRGRERVSGDRRHCTSSSARRGGGCAAFLFGWSELLLIRAASLGAISTTFAEYLLRVLGHEPSVGAVRDVRALRRGARDRADGDVQLRRASSGARWCRTSRRSRSTAACCSSSCSRSRSGCRTPAGTSRRRCRRAASRSRRSGWRSCRCSGRTTAGRT